MSAARDARAIAAHELGVSRRYEDRPYGAFKDAKDTLAAMATLSLLDDDHDAARLYAQAYKLLRESQRRMMARRQREREAAR